MVILNTQLKEIINSDLYRLGGDLGKKALLLNRIFNPAFKFIYVHRKLNFYRDKNKFIYLFYRVRLYRLNIKYGFEISNSAKIGKVNIGNNVLIAPGSFINFDVPSNSIVIGNPGMIKQCDTATNGYISWAIN